MLTLIPLGTSSAVPTRDRHLSAFALQREGELFLFDCGEGTQLRLMHAGLRPSRLKAVCISHFHGDHFFGLMGLLSTMSLLTRKHSMLIAGPAGIRQAVEFMADVSGIHFSFELDFVELHSEKGRQTVLETRDYHIEARPLDHRIETFGYRFEEAERPGRFDADHARQLGITENWQFRDLREGREVEKRPGSSVKPGDVISEKRRGAVFAYCPDTRPCENAVLLGRGASVMFHEATFGEDLVQRARETAHSTPADAARAARAAGADLLMLGHFSARYENPDVLVDEARTIFPRTVAAEELRRYVVKPEETARLAAGDR